MKFTKNRTPRFNNDFTDCHFIFVSNFLTTRLSGREPSSDSYIELTDESPSHGKMLAIFVIPELVMGREPMSAIPGLWLKSTTLTTRPSRPANILLKGRFRNIVNNCLSSISHDVVFLIVMLTSVYFVFELF